MSVFLFCVFIYVREFLLYNCPWRRHVLGFTESVMLPCLMINVRNDNDDTAVNVFGFEFLRQRLANYEGEIKVLNR